MKNKLKFIISILSFVLFSMVANAQSKTITGVVTEKGNGSPIPGVNVNVEGTSVGDVTDFDGKYTIEIDDAKGKTITFSYLGYQTKTVKITDGNNTINVSLAEDLLNLDEVIVTGTSGIATKKQLGSSITSIKASDLSDSKAVVSVGEALQGKVAGAYISRNSGNPAGGISVRLRGASTLSGSSDPLYIIDGVIVNNKSNQAINLGGYTQNRLVDINPNDIERIEVLKGAAAAAIYGSRASNGVIQIFTKKGKSGAPRVTFATSFNTNKIRKYLPYNDAQLTWDVNNVAIPATRYNYQDYIFNTASGHENSINVTGGSEKTIYSFSASEYKNGGIVRNTDFARKTLRMRIDQKMYDWLDVSLGSFISSNASNDMPNGKNYGPITALLFADNTHNQDPDQFGNYPSVGLWMPSPRETIDKIDATQKNFRSISDIQLKLNPFEGFRANYTFGYDYSTSKGLLFIPRGVNTRVNGASQKNTIKSSMYNSDFNMSYTFDIDDDIKSTSGFGYSYQYEKNEIFGVYNDQVGPIDGVIVTDPSNAVGGIDFRSEAAYWGGFLQQTFAYKNRLFLTMAGRIDGASTFGINERQQFYPKVSASYNISDEDFWEESAVGKNINALKLRAAWGQSGNLTALNPYQIYTNYNQSNYNNNIGYFPSTLQGNANAKPERQTELEFGADMSLLNNNLSLEFSYYNQNIEDLLIKRNLSPSTGFSNRYDNIGAMTNKGFEILIKGKPFRGDFNWDVSGTFSTNKNEVTSVEGGRLSLGMFGTSVAQTGQPIGVFYGTFFATDANGNKILDSNGFVQRARGHYEDVIVNGQTIQSPVQDFDGAGQPTGAILRKIIGDPNPDYVASLTNEFEYKDFGFRFQFDFVQGNQVMSWDKRMGYLFKGGQQTALELNGTIPKGSSKPNFFIFESFIEDGSYVKLREVSLFYNLNVNKPYLNNIKFTLSGTNLISFDNYYGFDPEVNTEGQSNGVRGQDMANVPIPQVYKLGLIFNF